MKDFLIFGVILLKAICNFGLLAGFFWLRPLSKILAGNLYFTYFPFWGLVGK